EQTPDDVQLRRRILKYYYEPPRAEAKIKAAIPHRVWLIQNFPDQNDYDLIGWNEYFSSGKSVEYKLLKSEWLKQVEANPKNLKIRFNTVDFIDESEWRDAEKLLLQGETLFPDNFKLSAKLFELYYRLANDSKSNEAENKLAVDIKIFRQKAAEKGDKYLALLKKERSRERDSERAKILPQLAAVEFDLEMFDKVKARATELVLEFGDDENDFNYGAATHEGNILLGRAALKEGNIERAKEYLLISARAPLRQKYNTLSYPNLTLAGELLAAGEKNIVLDFLKLCENFTGTDTKSLQLWQNEIRQGKTPDFKWY
ncbi:MAG TPA: hypothetical protein VNI84_14340, partial [Pyrinomonadaceae bacterium]|nr:hypothetical protein [Pyrinomonadaceae bacterium]